MITLLGYIIFTGVLSQAALDARGNLYVQELKYLPVHSYTMLGKKVRRLNTGERLSFDGNMCRVFNKQEINYRIEKIDILTGADLYIQVCTREEMAYLFKLKCSKKKTIYLNKTSGHN